MKKFDAFDTETINRPGRGEACLLIRKTGAGLTELKPNPKTFGEIFDFLRGKSWVAWNADFDARAIVHPNFIPWKKVAELGERERMAWRGYRFEMIPGKRLSVRRGRASFELFDLRQFFGCSLESWGREYLKESADGKAKIPRKWYTEFDRCLADSRRGRALAYGARDAEVLARALDLLLKAYAGAKIDVKSLMSSASIAKRVFGPIMRQSGLIPNGINRAFEPAFFGGRIEVFGLGEFRGAIKKFDVHSAYPAEMAKLCPFAPKFYKETTRGPEYSAHYVEIKVPSTWAIGPVAVRRPDGCVYFPVGAFRTWMTGLALSYCREDLGLKIRVLESLHVPITGEPIFGRMSEFYERRKDPISGIAFKLTMNSWYGCLCEIANRRIGSKYQHYGTFAAFPWAAYVTEAVRIKVDRLLRSPGARPLAAMTDGVLLSGDPEISPDVLGPGMGQWGLEGEFDRAVILGCGRYYLYSGGELVEQHLRGFPAKYPAAKLEGCRAKSKRIKMLEALSFKEWVKAYCIPEFNVLLETPRILKIGDDKRHWEGTFRAIGEAWRKGIDSKPLLCYHSPR